MSCGGYALLCDSFHISRVRIIADVKAKYRIDTQVPLCRPSALDFYYMHSSLRENMDTAN
jgi:hypothetical protein